MTVLTVLEGAGFVELVDHMGGDLAVVNSARVSFGKRKTTLDEKDEGLINYLAKNKHFSPFRHTQFQFHFKAPEYVARQAFKHLVGIEATSVDRFVDIPWNEISGRYVKMKPEFYTPKKFRKQSKNNKQASTDEEVEGSDVKGIYNGALSGSYDAYLDLISRGVSREQARGVLPVSFITEWYWTMSLEAAVHFVRLRMHTHAQKEIQEYGKAVLELIEPIAPLSVKALLNLESNRSDESK